MTVCRRRAPMFSVRSLTCQAVSAIRRKPSSLKVDVQPLGGQQRLVLLGQRCVWARSGYVRSLPGEGIELDADGQAALQLRNQVRGLGQVEGA